MFIFVMFRNCDITASRVAIESLRNELETFTKMLVIKSYDFMELNKRLWEVTLRLARNGLVRFGRRCGIGDVRLKIDPKCNFPQNHKRNEKVVFFVKMRRVKFTKSTWNSAALPKAFKPKIFMPQRSVNNVEGKIQQIYELKGFSDGRRFCFN